MGVNNSLDALLMVAEILMTIGALITKVCQDQLSVKNTSKSPKNSRLAALDQLTKEFPAMTVLGGICEIVGVVLFMVGFFYCAKEALVWSYQSYQRKKQQKQREKKDSNCAIKRVEVLPVDAKPKQLQRQKSETTKLFEQQFEASTIANTFLDDEKRKSSARLKQRRESRLRGTKPPMLQGGASGRGVAFR